MANAGIECRKDVSIPFMGEKMAGWLYPSQQHTTSQGRGPALVLAHGLGCTKELTLDVVADKFNRLGYTCLVFDYRCNGGSTGLPRNLIDFAEQQKDWHAAIAWVRELAYVDPERVGLFGTSFSGGHVIQIGAADHRLKAIISQNPFTDGLRSAFTVGLSVIPNLLQLGIRDLLFGTKQEPVLVALVGKPGEPALLNAHDAWEGIQPLIPAGFQPAEYVPAQIVVKMPLLRPGAYASKVQCPILFAICAKDTVAPADTADYYAKQAPQGTIKWYADMGHFDIYVGERLERAFKDYEEFLRQHLPV